MSLLNFLAGAIKPVTELIDNLHTSDEEKAEAKLKLEQVQNTITVKMLDLEGQVLKAKENIIVAEAKSESWLTANWRPTTMLSFLLLLFLYWFDVSPENLTEGTVDNLFTLIQIGIGGYIASRGVEKGIEKWKK